MAVNLASLIGRAVLRRRWGAFARDQRGVTAIEFGLLALPFFSIVGAILETSVIFLSGQVLDSAVHDVSRLIRTGQTQAGSTTIEDFRTQVCDRLYGLFPDCNDELFVEVQVLNTFNATSIVPPVDWNCDPDDCEDWTRDEAFVPGQGSSIVLVQVYYKWPVILRLGDLTLANLPSGKRLLGAAGVFRNEPFS